MAELWVKLASHQGGGGQMSEHTGGAVAKVERDDDPPAGEIVAKLFGEQIERLKTLLESNELNTVCVDGLTDLGCPRIVAPTVFAGVKVLAIKAIELGPDLASQSIQTGLLRLMARIPALDRLLRMFTRVLGRFEDKAKLRQAMIDDIKQSGLTPFGIKVNQVTPTEVVEALHAEVDQHKLTRRFEDLLGQLAAVLEARIDDLAELRLNWPDTVGTTASVIDTLYYGALHDDFVGRDEEMALLRSFLGDPDDVKARPFSWLLVAGRGGEGKSRLAFELVRSSRVRWRAGRLVEADLSWLLNSNWRPRKPTLMVIDYALDWPVALKRLLAAFAQRCVDFEYPLRVLLIAREGGRSLVEQLVGPGGETIRPRLYKAAGCEKGVLGLQPVSREAVIGLMQRRLRQHVEDLPPDDLLIVAAKRLDQATALGEQTPRPLFAAIAAEALASMIADRGGPGPTGWQELVFRIEKDQTLAGLIQRDRQLFWRQSSASDPLTETQRETLHENLLCLSTFTLGHVTQDALDEAIKDVAAQDAALAAKVLPSFALGAYAFDGERFQRMTSRSNHETLGALEPDILGAFFVLQRLDPEQHELTSRQRSFLVDMAWTVAARDAAAFVRRTFSDFPIRVAACGDLLPSAGVADAWVIELLRSLIADLGAAARVLVKEAESPGLTSGHQQALADEHLRLAGEALRLASRLKLYAASIGALGEDVLTSIATALKEAAYVASTAYRKELVENDPRYAPQFLGSSVIEPPQIASPLSDTFNAAATFFTVGSSADIIGFAPPPVPAASGSDQACPRRETIQEVMRLEDELLALRPAAEIRATLLTAERDLMFVLDALGDPDAVATMIQRAWRRLLEEDDDEVLFWIMRHLSGCTYLDGEKSRDKGDAVALARLREVGEKIQDLPPSLLARPKPQQPLTTVLLNVSYGLSKEPDFSTALGDFVFRLAKEDTATIDIVYGLAQLSSHETWRALEPVFNEDAAEKVRTALSPQDQERLGAWIRVVRAGLQRGLVSDPSAGADGVEVRRKFIQSRVLWIVVLLASFAGSGETADAHLADFLSMAQSDGIDWNDPDLMALIGQAGGLLAGVATEASADLRLEALETVCRDAAVEVIRALANSLYGVVPHDGEVPAATAEFLRETFARRLAAPDVLTEGEAYSLHEVIADVIVSMAGQAYVNGDAPTLKAWSNLFEAERGASDRDLHAQRLHIFCLLAPLLTPEGMRQTMPIVLANESGKDVSSLLTTIAIVADQQGDWTVLNLILEHISGQAAQ